MIGNLVRVGFPVLLILALADFFPVIGIAWLLLGLWKYNKTFSNRASKILQMNRVEKYSNFFWTLLLWPKLFWEK